MKLVVAWPDWTPRQDRCVMFSWVAEWADQVYLITSAPLPSSLRRHIHPRARVLHVRPPARGMDFVRAAGELAKGLAQQNARPDGRVVLQDLAASRLAVLARVERWLPRSRVRTVLSIYSPSPAFLCERGWRIDRRVRLPLDQEWLHFRVTLIRVLTEMIYVRFADAVSGNSEEICRDIVRVYRKKPRSVYHFPTAVDSTYFTPASHPGPRAKPVLLFVGRVYARKGIYDLLESAARLRSRGLEFEVRVLGDNQVEAEQIREAVVAKHLEETICFLPRQPREKVREEMQVATMLVLPSYKEGSPRVVKEAMACGCPVVAADLPGIRALDPEQNALTLVPAGDPQALTDAIEALLRDENQRSVLGQQGRRLVEEKFSPPVVARQMFELYVSLFE